MFVLFILVALGSAIQWPEVTYRYHASMDKLNFTEANKRCNITAISAEMNTTSLAILDTNHDYIYARRAIDSAWMGGSPTYHWIGLKRTSKGWLWAGNRTIAFNYSVGHNTSELECGALNVDTLDVTPARCELELPYVCVNEGDD